MLKLKILVIDDSPVVREMVRDAFEKEGFRVIEAPSGEEALKIAWQEHPDLIIADIKMPGIDGWEVCSQLRKHPYTSFVPFIFLTEKTEVSDRIKGLEMGADDYITKPFIPEELVARARAIFNRILKREEEKIIKSRGLSGSTQMMDLADLLQLFALNTKTGILKVVSDKGELGRIGFVEGRLNRAEIEKIKGVKALRRMLRWSGAHFEVEPFLNEKEPSSEFIGRIEEFLLSARKEEDELKKLEKELSRKSLLERMVSSVNFKEISKLEAKLLSHLEVRVKVYVEELLEEFGETDIEIYQGLVSLLRKKLVRVSNG